MKILSEGGKLALVLLIIASMLIFVFVYTSEDTTAIKVVENASLSIFAASLTAVLFDVLTQAIERRRWLTEKLRDLASSDSGFSSRALDQLREKGMLSNGTLSSQDLRRANLSSLDLRESVISESKFDNAEMSDCDFRNSKLDGSSFRGADMSRIQMSGASLKGCDFREANLDGAELDSSNVEGANFKNASLENVNWTNCKGRS